MPRSVAATFTFSLIVLFAKFTSSFMFNIFNWHRTVKVEEEHTVLKTPSKSRRRSASSTSKYASLASNEVQVINDFFGNLKRTPRTGWLNSGISKADCESVADHSWRMSIMVMLYDLAANDGLQLDVGRMTQMCVVHDVAETITGDITPEKSSGITREEKTKREEEAMEKILGAMEGGSAAANNLKTIWREYEDGDTDEAKFVKDVDRIEMISQAVIYERRFPDVKLDGFFESTKGKARFKQTIEWDREVRLSRNA